MKKKFIIIITTVLTLALSTGVFFSSAWGRDGGHGGDGDGNRGYLNILLGRASLSLTQTVKNIEKETGGLVIDAEIDREEPLFSSKEKLNYRIVTVKDGKATESLIDIFTGKTISKKSAGLVTRFWHLEVSPTSTLLQDLPLSMEEAMAAAEQYTNGKTLNAELREESGLLVYNVKTISENGIRKSVVDPENGKVYLVPEVVDHDSEEDEHR